MLAGAAVLDPARTASVVHLGELALDGRLRPVRGVLPAVAAAVAAGHVRVVVPAENAAEAALVPGAQVLAAWSLAEVAWRHGADIPEPARPTATTRMPAPVRRPSPSDLADVAGPARGPGGARGRRRRRAPPAHGRPAGRREDDARLRLPGLLPDLGEDEAVEVTAVHSVAGTFDPAGGLLRRPPFEDPHHTATAAAVIGGGSGVPRPGAASRAHRGVLFMDEAPEFSPGVLQTLRQPLEHGELVIQRAGGTARYPARFQLVLAANPCPCGKAVGKGLDCVCPPIARRRYWSRLSGPLLDRVDLQVEVHAVSRAQIDGAPRGETTQAVAERVGAAREAQAARLAGTPWRTNAEVPGHWMRAALRGERGLLTELDRALDRGLLSLRGVDRVLRVAWTLADLAGRDAPGRSEIGQGLVLRTRGQASA